eukprot:CAMPEP_0194283758 /NCGR_PEP_ID=MMETSP0169-20130528/26077_1 /TAXON_ID=218684 /ORGANISM="Corethron pennatum, Strain L29A3" /LENGTH=173 /DNA_ID=CAMNT_0039029425 /DNA_START=211 /DNA_END=732 /DNA_ORIENTATION=-
MPSAPPIIRCAAPTSPVPRILRMSAPATFRARRRASSISVFDLTDRLESGTSVPPRSRKDGGGRPLSVGLSSAPSQPSPPGHTIVGPAAQDPRRNPASARMHITSETKTAAHDFRLASQKIPAPYCCERFWAVAPAALAPSAPGGTRRRSEREARSRSDEQREIAPWSGRDSG